MKYLITVFITLLIIGGELWISENNTTMASGNFHSQSEMYYFQNHLSPIPPGKYFLHSIECKGCHGFDTLQIASIDSNGIDINLYDDWEATMMANSAIDPLWRAKVSHEILIDTAHAAALEDKCTSCHAPMGHFNAFFRGESPYSIAMLDTDSLGLNGVACTGCHEIGTNNLGNVFSGDIPYDTNKIEYGPFPNPVAGPMQLYVGMTPTYSPHMSEGRFCSPCHTLIVNTIDLAGNQTGETFVEQATFHEWENSTFPADNVTCQECHMPRTNDSIIIANGILNLAPRAPFNKHKFTGANEFMVKLIKDNKTSLGITTEDKRFDSTLSAINSFLQKSTLGIKITLENLTTDTAFMNVRLTNFAGHKFPSGYPSRRAVLQLIAVDQNFDTVFQSGTFDSTYEVNGIDTTFEPHYNIIRDENEVQIYEMVMGDVNGNKTTVLARADTALKDNRLAPEGFVSTHLSYDTMRIVGEAFADPDFNKDVNGNEGTGKDIVHYHIPVNGVNGTLTFYARVYFQTVPPGWLKEMFSMNSAPIDTFRNMFNASDRSPFLIGTDTISIITLGNAELALEKSLIISNNPVTDGKLYLKSAGNVKIERIDVFSIQGQLVKVIDFIGQNEAIIPIPAEKGIYLICIYTDHGKVIKKIVSE